MSKKNVTDVTEVVKEGNTGSLTKTSRSWDITINNFSERDIEWLKSLEVSKMTVSKEIGEAGTPHLQGKLTFKRSYRLAALKKLNSRAHWEITLADADNNYVRKVDSEVIIEVNNKQQGKRTDLIELKDKVLAGKEIDDIVVEDPMAYHQYGRTLEKIEDIRNKSRFRTEMTEGLWIHGPTGSGKSHEAFRDYSEKTHYLWTNDKGWWDGYTGQEIVIMNDFRGEIPYNMLLQLIDKWPVSVPRRNRKPIPFVSKKVIITSSLHPKNVYKNREVEDNIGQLLRRIKCIEIDTPLTLRVNAGSDLRSSTSSFQQDSFLSDDIDLKIEECD